MGPFEKADDDSGTAVDLPELEDDEEQATKSASIALQKIGQILNTMLFELDHPKGMNHRYPAKAAEFALDALDRAIEFLNGLESYVKDGIRQ
jgi:hypothetical protein